MTAAVALGTFRYPTIGTPDKLDGIDVVEYTWFRYPTIGTPDKLGRVQGSVCKGALLKKARFASAHRAFFLPVAYQ